MWFILLWIPGVAYAEIVTLSQENNLTCVVTGDSARSTVYLTPPVNSDFTNPSKKIDDSSLNDWEKINSTRTNQTVVIDKRWEEFEILNEDDGYGLSSKSLVFSICIFEKFTLNIFSLNFSDDTWIDFTPENFNIPEKKDQCSWVHYTLSKTGTIINLTAVDGSIQSHKMNFDPYWIYFNSSVVHTTFWKLHKYEFRQATSTTQEEKSNVSVVFTDNLCLSMYVSVDKGSFLDISLKTNDTIINKTVIGFNDKTYKTWQRVEIETKQPGLGYLSFYRGVTQQGSSNGYWAIDDIRFCTKDIEIYRTSLKNDDARTYMCKTLEIQSKHLEYKDANVLTCDRPGFLGKNCNISCNVVLGQANSYCQNQRICNDANSCFCSWGHQEPNCNIPCDEGSWGLFCKNKCPSKCSRNCSIITGECLESMSRIDDYLPEKITVTPNEIHIFVPNGEEISRNLSYNIKLICVSLWCKNKIVKKSLIKIGTEDAVSIKFEEWMPFTDYQVIVSPEQNQNIEKKYNVSKDYESDTGIKNVSVFSSNASNLWIRFTVSNLLDEDLDLSSYKIWYWKKDDDVPPHMITRLSWCDLWNNFICAEINNLERDSLYHLIIESSRGLSKTINAVTTENVSQAPENLWIKLSENSTPIVTWNHPSVTNGPLEAFVLDVTIEESFEDYSISVDKVQRTYEFELPLTHFNTKYIISVRGFNKYEGERSKISTTFFPLNPEFPVKKHAFCEVCDDICYWQIPRFDRIKNVSYAVVGLPYSEGQPQLSAFSKISKEEFEKTKNGELTFVNVVSDKNYLLVKTSTKKQETISLRTNTNIFLYLLLSNDTSYYMVYPVTVVPLSPPLLGLMSYLTPIVAILASLLLCLMLLLLLLFRRRKNISKNIPLSEARNLIQDAEMSNNRFTNIEVKFLEKYLKHILLKTKEVISQFRSLPAGAKPTIHACYINKNKNRDLQNVPYDYNRVVLEQMEGMGTNDYINASYISGLYNNKTYIATQGPKYSTIKDFWRMIWQEQVEAIVMATNFMEDNKRKCAEYFPQASNETFECGKMLIKITNEENYEHYIVRHFDLIYRRIQRKIQHFQLKWNPNLSTALYANCVVPLIKRIRLIRENSNRPIVVHCSSGVNRTGTLILCDLALQMIKATKMVDFFTLVKKLREQRPNMLSSEKQYILAHLIVLECVMEEENTFKSTVSENLKSTLLVSQLNYLERLSWHDDLVQSWTLDQRYANNSLFYPIDGYTHSNKFVCTALPDEDSINKFWTAIISESIHTILLLNKPKCQICPHNVQSNGTSLTVKEHQTVKTTYCTSTELILQIVQTETNNLLLKRNINLFQVNERKFSLQDIKHINDILNISEDVNKNFSELQPILIACNDGLTKCGVFLALDYIIQKCIKELEVDVCNAIRIIRRSRLPFVKTIAEIKSLYIAVIEYLQKFDEYSSIL